MEVLEISSKHYPLKLREIPKPPETLWVRGTLPSFDSKFLTVVGSRALSSYGRQACEYLISGLAGYPISIISGLALGADACAHKASLACGLHTIGIPGSGLNNNILYPRANVRLAQEIVASGGALLSEHEPNHQARLYDFPSRNRIMVGMSDAVLMIEAGERSGTLITARLTSDYNRDLLCIPHRIGDNHGYGSHLFLRLGAIAISEPSHILQALGIEKKSETSLFELYDLSEHERVVYDALNTPGTRDEVIRASSLASHETISTLGILELKGVLREEFGQWRRSA